MPATPNRKFSIPATGTEVGVWGSNDLNPNFAALDNILGSVTTLNLAGSGPVALTDAQQQVAIIRLTGILTGNVAVTVTEPAFWIIDNQTSGNFVVTIGGATGNVIATAQGSRATVAYDGTNAFFVDQGETGTTKRFLTTAVPAWITACTVNPYLPCVGGTFLGATYPALAALLGTAFGGNGITTFGLPDFRSRMQIDMDAAAGLVTTAGSGVDGTTLGAAGGSQLMPQHTHVWNPTTQTWPVSLSNSGGVLATASEGGVVGASADLGNPITLTANVTVTPNGSISNAGAGLSQNMPPAMVAGITMVKT